MLYSHYINLNRQIFMLNFYFILELFGIFSQQNKWGGGEYIAVQFASGKILSPRAYIINAALNPKQYLYTKVYKLCTLYTESTKHKFYARREITVRNIYKQ